MKYYIICLLQSGFCHLAVKTREIDKFRYIYRFISIIIMINE